MMAMTKMGGYSNVGTKKNTHTKGHTIRGNACTFPNFSGAFPKGVLGRRPSIFHFISNDMLWCCESNGKVLAFGGWSRVFRTLHRYSGQV